MSFKNNYIFNQLQHNPKHYITKLISDETLFFLLWYFVSKESYPQRNSYYDNIFGGNTSPYDRFFQLFLYNTLSLDELIIFNNANDLDKYVDGLSSRDLNKNLLYIHVNKMTSFFAFFEKIRNSIAHGTFNLTNRFFMIGQIKSNPNSVMNFYYQTNDRFGEQFDKFLRVLQTSINIDQLCINSLKMCPNVENRNGDLYYKSKKIIIEHNFKFQPVNEEGTELSQIINLVNKNYYVNVIIIICCQSHRTFNVDELISKNIEVISYKDLFSFFECKIQHK